MSPTTLILGLFLSLLVAGLPTVFWAALVWWCDRYEREPIRLVTAAFLWGALPAVVLALALEAWLGVPFAGLRTAFLGEVVSSSGIAPLVEELAKGAALLIILLFWHDELHDVLDGILYGAMIGFGFAMTENLLYFIGALAEGGWGDWGVTVFLRSSVFGLNHAFFTAFTGAGLGYAQTAGSRWRRRGLPLFGLGMAILAHAVHNLGASLASYSPLGLLLSLANDSGGVLLVAVMMGLALRQEQRWLRAGLADEVGHLLTAAEYEMLSSLRGRGRMLAQARRAGGWRAVRAMRQFQEAATEWAFCKCRARGRGPDAYLVQLLARSKARLVAARARLDTWDAEKHR